VRIHDLQRGRVRDGDVVWRDAHEGAIALVQPMHHLGTMSQGGDARQPEVRERCETGPRDVAHPMRIDHPGHDVRRDGDHSQCDQDNERTIQHGCKGRGQIFTMGRWTTRMYIPQPTE
jgi:hypothetical protein